MDYEKKLSHEFHIRIAVGILLSIVTFGLFHIYYEYKMGSELQTYMESNGLSVPSYLAVTGLALACFGLTIVSDAIYQHELNRLIR